MHIVSFVTCCCPEVKERADDSAALWTMCRMVQSLGGGCPGSQHLKRDFEDLWQSGASYPAAQQGLAGSSVSQDRAGK